MNMSNKLLPLVARILISLVFIKSGIYKIGHFNEVAKQMHEAGITLATDYLLAGAILLLLAGSFLLITGYKGKLGAFLLVLFLVPVTIAFHWNLNDPVQINNLLRNGVYLAALLMIISYGTGDWSLGKVK
jgi:putative oxidoreductase